MEEKKGYVRVMIRINNYNEEGQMSRKKVLAWVALLSLLLFVFAANQAIGKEKTVVLNVPACSS
jgi:hypothetical protein